MLLSLTKSEQILGTYELVLPNTFFQKKEKLFKKWLTLNSSEKKKSKLSLLDQIKLNIVIDIHYGVSNINDITTISDDIKTPMSRTNNTSTVSRTNTNANNFPIKLNETHRLSVKGDKSINMSLNNVTVSNSLNVSHAKPNDNKSKTTKGVAHVKNNNLELSKVKKKSVDDRLLTSRDSDTKNKKEKKDIGSKAVGKLTSRNHPEPMQLSPVKKDQTVVDKDIANPSSSKDKQSNIEPFIKENNSEDLDNTFIDDNVQSYIDVNISSYLQCLNEFKVYYNETFLNW
jgi:hypothetical protein